MSKFPPAILFDWDNTLADSFPLLVSAHDNVREQMGAPAWSDAEARLNIRLAAKDAFPIWYGDRAAEAEAIYIAHIRENHLKSMTYLDGADALLEYLHMHDVPMGIISNKRREFLRAEISALEWDPYFQVIIGADDVPGPAKPDPAGLIMALDSLSIPASDRGKVWYVGDTENDIKTAKAAGVVPVFIENHSMSDPAMIATLCPAITFQNPRECLAYCRTLG